MFTERRNTSHSRISGRRYVTRNQVNSRSMYQSLTLGARQFSDPKLWPHLFIALFTFNAGIVYALYGPTIITSFGFEPLRSNALSSVGQWISLILVIGGGYIADWWGRRGILVCLYLTCTFVTVVSVVRDAYDESDCLTGICTSSWPSGCCQTMHPWEQSTPYLL